MATSASVYVTDQKSGQQLALFGFVGPTAPAAPTTGDSFVQAGAVCDPTGTNAANVDSAGNLQTRRESSTTVALTTVAASTSAVSLKAANTSRLAIRVRNDDASSGNLYLGFTSSVTTTAASVKLAPGDIWEPPVNYTGAIYGIWDATGGPGAQVTEYTP